MEYVTGSLVILFCASYSKNPEIYHTDTNSTQSIILHPRHTQMAISQKKSLFVEQL